MVAPVVSLAGEAVTVPLAMSAMTTSYLGTMRYKAVATLLLVMFSLTAMAFRVVVPLRVIATLLYKVEEVLGSLPSVV